MTARRDLARLTVPPVASLDRTAQVDLRAAPLAQLGDPSTPTGPGAGEERTVPVVARIPAEAAAAIEALATRQGVPVSALVSQWLLDGLAASQQPSSMRAMVDRIAADIDLLRDLLG